MNSYKFMCNKDCKYFPCHKVDNLEDFNCMFCYCPLYMLDDKCGGNFRYTSEGIKDCSNCTIPHLKDIGYDYVQKKIKDIIKIIRENHFS